MFYSDDPLRDFDRYDAYQAQLEAKLPQCENKRCKCRIIHDEKYFDVDGEILCEACMRERYERSTKDFIRDQE
jgi:hypothetical protein